MANWLRNTTSFMHHCGRSSSQTASMDAPSTRKSVSRSPTSMKVSSVEKTLKKSPTTPTTTQQDLLTKQLPESLNDLLYVEFLDTLLSQDEQYIKDFELGVDVNFYITKLNIFLNQPLIRNVYTLDVGICNGRLISEVLTLLGRSRICQRLHFIGIEPFMTMMSKARSNINRQLRLGAGSGVDSLSVSFISSTMDSIQKNVSPRRFHLILVGHGGFHRLLSMEERLNFFKQISDMLLGNGICVINLYEDDIICPPVKMFSLGRAAQGDVEGKSPNCDEAMLPELSCYGRSSGCSAGVEHQTNKSMLEVTQRTTLESCSDDPIERIINTVFSITSTKKEGLYVIEKKSDTKTRIRTVRASKMLEIADSAGLKCTDSFVSFRSAIVTSKDRSQAMDELPSIDSCKVFVLMKK